jgi:hypothetical protein
METKELAAKIKASSAESRTLTYTISMTAEDRGGDRILSWDLPNYATRGDVRPGRPSNWAAQ